jgi:hypothetical protein
MYAFAKTVSMIRVFLNICKHSDDDGFGDIDTIDSFVANGAKITLARAVCSRCRARLASSVHARYRRHYVHIKDGQVTDTLLEVVRLRCPSCGMTHALLPPGAVPYSVFSIRFIAFLIMDWKNKRFSSIECLCEHYQITTNTFYRIKKRFEACAALALGMIDTDPKMLAAAKTIAGRDVVAADSLLRGFFDKTARSFCQVRGP